MLCPFPRRFLPEDKQIFNYCLSRARQVIKTLLESWQQNLEFLEDTATKITQAACCLPNYIRTSEINNPPSAHFYCPQGFVNLDDNDGNIIPGDSRSEISSSALESVQGTGSNTYSQSASDLRDTIMSFMTTPQGEVSWRYARVRDHGHRLQS